VAEVRAMVVWVVVVRAPAEMAREVAVLRAMAAESVAAVGMEVLEGRALGTVVGVGR